MSLSPSLLVADRDFLIDCVDEAYDLLNQAEEQQTQERHESHRNNGEEQSNYRFGRSELLHRHISDEDQIQRPSHRNTGKEVIERRFIKRYEVTDQYQRQIDENERNKRIAGRDENLNKLPLTVHQGGQRPIRDAEHQHRHDDINDLHETVQFTRVVVVHQKPGILALQNHRETQHCQYCEGDPKARSLIAFVLQFPKGLVRMQRKIERKLEQFFFIQMEQPSFFFAFS
jgi:hypothetical protein